MDQPPNINRKNSTHVYAVIRVDRYSSDKEPIISVKEVHPTWKIAKNEVERLNEMARKKGGDSEYICQCTRWRFEPLEGMESKELYKQVIDGLVGVANSEPEGPPEVFKTPEVPEQQARLQEFIAGLDSSQKAVLEEMLVKHRSDGVRDALSYLQTLDLTFINKEGERFSGSTYGYTYRYDYETRVQGWDWKY